MSDDLAMIDDAVSVSVTLQYCKKYLYQRQNVNYRIYTKYMDNWIDVRSSELVNYYKLNKGHHFLPRW